MDNAFERRSQEAWNRRKMPTEGDATIHLHDSVDKNINPPASPTSEKVDDQKNTGEPLTLYVDKDGNFAYWADGKVHVLNDADKAERARREREPGTPLQGNLPPLGFVHPVDSFDEIPAVEASAETAAQPQGPGNAGSEPEAEPTQAREEAAASTAPESEPILGEETTAGPAQTTAEAPPPPPPRAPIEQYPRQGVVPDFIARDASQIRPRQEAITRSEPPALAEILNDRKKQADFYKLIEGRGRKDLVEKFATAQRDPNAMAPEDWEEINTARHEFQRRSSLAEEVRSMMGQEEVLHMLQSEPAFAFLRNTVAPERAAEIIKQHVESVLMGATDIEVDSMIYAHRSNRDIKQSTLFAGLMHRARRVLGDQNLNAEDIKWGSLDSNILRRIQRPGFFAWMEGERRERSVSIINSLNLNLKAMSAILGATLSADTDLQRRVIAEAQTGQRASEVPRGPASHREYMSERATASNKLNPQSLLNSVPEFKRTYRARFGADWSQHSPQQREENFFRSFENEMKERGEHRSWFGALLAAFLGIVLTRAKQDTQLRNAFMQA